MQRSRQRRRHNPAHAVSPHLLAHLGTLIASPRCLALCVNSFGRVEKEAEKPKAEQEKIEVPKELIEVAAIVAPKKPKTPAIDFIPVRVSLADLDATRLLAELRAMEARLEKLDRRLSDPKPKPVRINIVKATDDDDDAALILLGMPVPKQPRKGIAIDDDDLAALLLAA